MFHYFFYTIFKKQLLEHVINFLDSDNSGFSYKTNNYKVFRYDNWLHHLGEYGYLHITDYMSLTLDLAYKRQVVGIYRYSRDAINYPEIWGDVSHLELKCVTMSNLATFETDPYSVEIKYHHVK